MRVSRRRSAPNLLDSASPETPPPSTDRVAESSCPRVLFRHLHVGSVGFSYHPNILVGCPPHHLGRRTHSDRTRGYRSAFENHRSDPYDRMSTDSRPIENNGSGSNEALVAN